MRSRSAPPAPRRVRSVFLADVRRRAVGFVRAFPGTGRGCRVVGFVRRFPGTSGDRVLEQHPEQDSPFEECLPVSPSTLEEKQPDFGQCRSRHQRDPRRGALPVRYPATVGGRGRRQPDQVPRSPNAAERALRGAALGKAWLFCGSDRGGERTTFMYTLITTAKLKRRRSAWRRCSRSRRSASSCCQASGARSMPTWRGSTSRRRLRRDPRTAGEPRRHVAAAGAR